MTKEIVELPDRKSGDINEIRDKKIALAKDATAQSDLPQQLEYLIKNGQTGEFMNVLDSYINEKIRSALGSLIASLDKGAAGTTKAIACIDTNNDLGIINPANLASVLGGVCNVLRGQVLGVSGSATSMFDYYSTGPKAIMFFVDQHIDYSNVTWQYGFIIRRYSQGTPHIVTLSSGNDDTQNPQFTINISVSNDGGKLKISTGSTLQYVPVVLLECRW